MRKPAWFETRARELEGRGAIEDVSRWLSRGGANHTRTHDGLVCEEESGSMGRWTHANIVMELGGWLKAMDRCTSLARGRGPPRSHARFSCLPWTTGVPVVAGDELDENADVCEMVSEEETNTKAVEEEEDLVSENWWADVDDIEEVD